MRFTPALQTLLFALIGGCDLWVAGVDDKVGTGDSGLAPLGDVVGLGIAPNDPFVALGDTVSFTASAWYGNGASEDVTDVVTWSVSDPRVATIRADGVAETWAAGGAEVRAALAGELDANVFLTVHGEDVLVEAVELSPGTLVLAVGDEVRLTATGTFSDGGTGDVTSTCTWGVAEDGIISVDRRGGVIAVGPGSTDLTGECGDVSDTIEVTVEAEGTDLGLPNLRISSLDVVLGVDSVTYTVGVANLGTAVATEFFVDVFADLDAAPDAGSTYDGTAWVAGLGPGESTTAAVTVHDAPTGVLSSWAWADADDWLEESDDDDNQIGPVAVTVDSAPDGPQLEVVSFEADNGILSTDYTAVIRNSGDVAAEGFWIDLWSDSEDDPGTCETGDRFVWVDRVDPGETWTWQVEFDDAPWVTTWASVLYVDSCDHIIEQDESDNLSRVDVGVLL